MAMLEGGVGAVAAASGHTAQFMAITSICEPGHNFVSSMNLYGGTFNQFRVYFKRFGIPCKFVEGQNAQKIKEAIDEKTRAVYIETIGNPQFNVPDIAAISSVCHEAGIPLIVDNTFGLETLALRADRPVSNTLALARWLQMHPCISMVSYPGLESHPDYELARTALPRGQGGVLTFGVAGNVKEVAAVVDNLKLCSHLANVGDAKTLIIHPWRTTHQQIPDEEKIKGGVTPDLIRISLSLEHIDDITHDFEQAFVGAGLKSAEGWTPTWKQGLSPMASDGTLYAPKPGQSNGESKGKETAFLKVVASAL